MRTAVLAPRMNAICEHLVGTLRRELPDRTLILNQAHLRAEYQEHCNSARPHQGIDQRIPDLTPVPASSQQTSAPARSAEEPILSGLINEYLRAA